MTAQQLTGTPDVLGAGDDARVLGGVEELIAVPKIYSAQVFP